MQAYPELLPHLFNKCMGKYIQWTVPCCSAALQLNNLVCQHSVLAQYLCPQLLRQSLLPQQLLIGRTVLQADDFPPARLGGVIPDTDKAPSPVAGLDMLLPLYSITCFNYLAYLLLKLLYIKQTA
jgi:hypothetical protein